MAGELVRVRVGATVLALGALAAGVTACDGSAERGVAVPLLLVSTDVASGLIDTHGGQGSCPVGFDANALHANDPDFVPQDMDDGYMLAMALNLDALGLVSVDAIVPTFGNATLPAEMLVARRIVWELKGRRDIPIVPGAVAPAAQVLRAAPRWFDGDPVEIAGPEGSFAASCTNPGVDSMRERLLASARPMTVVAVGPLTDVACLLGTVPEVAGRIEEIIILASQVEGDSLTINGKVVNDFNFRLDPTAGAMLLAAATEPEVPLRLMAFRLSGQTSQKDDLIHFDASTLAGPSPSTPESERSLRWLLAAGEGRDAYWASVFGSPEGPFDQYALAAAVWPQLFDCQEGRAHVEQCPFPAWSPRYPTDGEGNPTESPFNRADNPCLDHGAEHGGALAQVPAQLIVSLDPADEGPLVRGRSGIDGNLPNLDARARRVTVCTDFASAAARQEFEELLYENTW